jgi:hypothetical protein
MASSESIEAAISEIGHRLSEPDRMCGWGGCREEFTGPTPPRGWIMLTIGRAQGELHCILCPKHTRELDGLLKSMGGASGDIVGNA